MIALRKPAPGMTVAVCPVRPDSRGTIMATSKDPFAKAEIRPNYLAVENDVRVLIAGMRFVREIFAAPAIGINCKSGFLVISEAGEVQVLVVGAEIAQRIALGHGQRGRLARCGGMEVEPGVV